MANAYLIASTFALMSISFGWGIAFKILWKEYRKQELREERIALAEKSKVFQKRCDVCGEPSTNIMNICSSCATKIDKRLNYRQMIQEAQALAAAEALPKEEFLKKLNLIKIVLESCNGKEPQEVASRIRSISNISGKVLSTAIAYISEK